MSASPPPRAPRLKRLLAALRARDWLGLAIEIAVVTVGVLFAFEIEQWGQRLERGQHEHEFIQQLYSDAAIAEEELRPIIETQTSLLRDVQQALRAEAEGDFKAIDALPKTATFGCGLTNMAPAPNSDTNFEELLESDRLSLLSDPTLRKVIRDLAAARAMGAAQVESSRDQLQIHLPSIDRYYRLKLGRKLEPLCNIDWAGLLRDPIAVNATNRLYRRHLNTWRARERTYESTVRARAMLACKLGKPECKRSG